MNIELGFCTHHYCTTVFQGADEKKGSSENSQTPFCIEDCLLSDRVIISFIAFTLHLNDVGMLRMGFSMLGLLKLRLRHATISSWTFRFRHATISS